MPSDNADVFGRIPLLVAVIPLWIRYLVAGTGIGGIWIINNSSLLNRSIGMVLALIVLPPLLHLARYHLVYKGTWPNRSRASMVRFTAAKAALVVAAVVGTILITPVTSNAPLFVGVGLIAIIAIFGPLFHRRMLINHPGAVESEYSPARTSARR